MRRTRVFLKKESFSNETMTHRPRRKLKPDTVRQALEMRRCGRTIEAIASALGISVGSVSNILKGRVAEKAPSAPTTAASQPRRRAPADEDEVAERAFAAMCRGDEDLRTAFATERCVFNALAVSETYSDAIYQVRTPERVAKLALFIEQGDRADARQLLERAIAALDEGVS